MEHSSTPPIVVLTITSTQLTELIEHAVTSALDQFVASQPPPERWLKSKEMAKRMGISESQLANLVREGVPFLSVGATGQRRYEPEQVLAWAREKGRK